MTDIGDPTAARTLQDELGVNGIRIAVSPPPAGSKDWQITLAAEPVNIHVLTRVCERFGYEVTFTHHSGFKFERTA